MSSSRLPRALGRVLFPALCALALACLSPLAAAPAEAQCTDPTQVECGGAAAPTVTISPGSLNVTGSTSTYAVQVRIDWCDDSGLDLSTIYITLNNSDVRSAFTTTSDPPRTGCLHAAHSEGTLTLADGTHSLRASIQDVEMQPGSDNVTYVYDYVPSGPVVPDTFAVQVTPKSGTLTRAALQQATERFTVSNPGNATITDTVVVVCAGSAVSCTPSAHRVTVGARGSVSVGVNYRGGAAGSTATIRLKAWRIANPAVRDSGLLNVSFVTPPAAGSVGETPDLTLLDRDACVTISAGAGAAFECGDLRAAHAFPTTTVLGTPRTPVLLYNSQHARPYPLVAATVTVPTGATAVRAELRVNGAMVGGVGSWTNLTAGTSYRIVRGFDAGSGYLTGTYPYTYTVVATLATGDLVLHSRSGTLAIVNRRSSPFGAGWWLAGLEQLYFVSGGILWVGGDGSTRLYTPVAGGGGVTWTGPAYDRPDTLRKVGTEYVRTLPGRVEVVFDGAGRHVRTRNRMGHVSRFYWDGGGTRVDSLSLPTGPAFNTGLRYRFQYTGGRLTQVVAPTAEGGPARDVVVVPDASGRITAFTGPDTTRVDFGYTGTDPRITSRTDRRRTTTSFTYDAASRLWTSTTPVDTQTVTLTFAAAEGKGLTPRVGAVWTTFDGPRTDTADVTLFYLDRFGAPVRVRNAVGLSTWLTRGDPRFPGLVTRVRQTNDAVLRASYDARGNLQALVDSSTVVNGRFATTLYEWDQYWDALLSVTLPEGETTTHGYDALGRPAWSQAGPYAERRVTVAYNDTTHTRAPGLVKSVTDPVTGVEQYEYDLRGNLAATVDTAADGTVLRATRVADRIGRTLKTVAPDGAEERVVSYDAMDRPVLTESWGPAVSYDVNANEAAQTLSVQTYYDRAGAPDSIARWSTPDPAAIGRITTRWKRDAIGRAVTEIAPDATPGTLADNPVNSAFYDPAGNVIGTKSRRGLWTRTTYDALGRPKRRITDGVTYPVMTQSFPAPTWAFPYFRQDAAGNFTLANSGSYGVQIPADTATFAYDSAGNLVRADNRDARISRVYNRNGTLLRETQQVRTYAGNDFTKHSYALEYRYDLNGRRTLLIHPRSISSYGATRTDSTRYSYAAGTGELAQVYGPVAPAFTFEYDRWGRLERQVRGRALPGSGVEETFVYDRDGRFTRRSETRDGVVTHADTLAYNVRTGRTVQARGLLDRTELAYTGRGALLWSKRVDRQTLDQSEETYLTDALANQLGSDVQPMVAEPAAAEQTAHDYQAGTGRLLATEWLAASGPQGQSATSFDAAGNEASRVISRSVVTPYTGYNQTGVVHSNITATLRDVAVSWYGADERLRVVERRSCLYFWNGSGQLVCDPNKEPAYENRSAFEEYRYDALGRRVLVRTRQHYACKSYCMERLQRTVWDGDQVLYEISAPGDTTAAVMEADTGLTRKVIENNRHTTFFPYGRVLYVHGGELDAPLGVVRMEYSDSIPQPELVIPQANWKGSYDTGYWKGPCVPIAASTLLLPPADSSEPQRGAVDYEHCIDVDWPAAYLKSAKQYRRGYSGPRTWMGSLITEGRDASGLYYRRNRFYDSETGRFTQEDPIGMAGGINVYGFANGDPVHYSDPYGLCPLPKWICKTLAGYNDWSNNTTSGNIVSLFLPVAATTSEPSAVNHVVDRLEARAIEIHNRIRNERTRNHTTTATARVRNADGTTEIHVASSEPRLRAEQRAALQPGEIEIRGAGHAEATIINNARGRGQTVEAVAASRPICENCASLIESVKAKAVSALKILSKLR